LIEHFDPRPPEIGEAFGEKDAVKSIPADGVKSFPKVKLEDSSRGGAPMAGLDNISRIDKVFGNRATRDETSLIWVNKEGDEGAKPKGEAFGVDFETAVLQRDRAEVVGAIGAGLLGKQNNVGLVDRAKIRCEVMKALEGFHKVMFDKVPIPFEESRAKAIRPRTGIVVHGEKGSTDFIKREGADEGGSLSGVQGSGGD
jgi:hypothetical protein